MKGALAVKMGMKPGGTRKAKRFGARRSVRHR